MREFIYRYKPSERDNVQDISQTMFYKLNEEVVKFFDEKIENELDKKFEQGAIDFNLNKVRLILNYLFSNIIIMFY